MRSSVDAATVTWTMRVAVFASVLAPLTIASGVDAWDDVARVATSVIAWALWAVALLCVLVPASVSLTALRLAVPTLLVSSVASLLADTTSASIAASIVVLVTVLLVFAAEIGDSFVQVSAYGDERRHLLHCPPASAATQVLAWLIWVAIGVVSVAAANSGAWVLAAATGALFVVACATLPRRFHRFSRRWLVRVPAGLVIHDHVVLAETAMFPKRSVAAVRLSEGDDAADLTGGVRRLGVRIDLTDFETIVLAATKSDPGGRAIHAKSVTVCPSRPGRAVRELTTPPPSTT